jgi:hypothetical protein
MDKAQRIAALVAKNPTLKAEDLQNVGDVVLAALEAQGQNPAPAQNPVNNPPNQQPQQQPAPQPPAVPQQGQGQGQLQAATAQPQQPTLESLLAAADPSTREAFQAIKTAGANKKLETITALKASGRCKFSDDELSAKSQKELDTLVELAGLTASAPVDFGGLGITRAAAAASQTGVPKPPDQIAAIKAAQGKADPPPTAH